MRILLLGKNGQLGSELNKLLRSELDFIALDFPIIDLGDADNLHKNFEHIKPEIIINAGAYTAVDKAEQEIDKAYSINAKGPGVLAELCRKHKAILIHYSTDYVFDGKNGPYVETDEVSPLNEYGKSKLAGEKEIQSIGGDYIILRTSWVYNMKNNNFVTKVLQWARDKETIKIVDDQVSNPTLAFDLAQATVTLLQMAGEDYQKWFEEKKGLYHLAGDGFISRFGWAKKILELDPQQDQQIVKKILPVSSSLFSTPAGRPMFSALDCSKFLKTFGFKLPEWQRSLGFAMKTLSNFTEC